MVQFQQRTDGPQISLIAQRKVWDEWTRDKDFKLNPDKDHTDTAIQGSLQQEKAKGLKYCPCRLQYKDFDKDMELICPCNFKAQQTWKDKGMCWCGLFVRR